MYKQQSVPIQLGQLGLYRDDSQDKIPVGSLYDCRNVFVRRGLIEKTYGSQRMNPSAVADGILSAIWWQPTVTRNRFVMAAGDGKTYYYEYPKHQAEVTPESGSPTTLITTPNTYFLPCGIESAGAPRKLFIMTGSDPVQVITADGLTRRTITTPALDWSGKNQPIAGIVQQGRAILFGNQNNPHTIYISTSTDHENFQGMDAEQLDIYPGEGEGLISVFTYKGRLFFAKRPFGLYWVDISNPDVTQWTVNKSISTFTASASHGAAEVLDDCLICNSSGSVTSLQATLNFGDVANSDLFSLLRVETYQQIFCNQGANSQKWLTFYQFRKEVLITYRSIGSTVNDMLAIIDVSRPSTPKVLWNDNVQANCLGQYADINNIMRPFFGSNDGFLYNYDIVKDANVNGEAYNGYFTTPALDFGWVDPNLAERNKIFEFLEVTFEACGRWNLFVESYVDGKYVETVLFDMSYGPVLDDFQLDTDKLSGRIQRSIRMPLHGQGRVITFKFYNDQLNQYFKVSKAKVSFKVSGEAQKGAKE